MALVKHLHVIFCMVVLLAVIGAIAEKHLSDNDEAISKVPTTHKVLALTIDDGPQNTPPPCWHKKLLTGTRLGHTHTVIHHYPN